MDPQKCQNTENLKKNYPIYPNDFRILYLSKLIHRLVPMNIIF